MIKRVIEMHVDGEHFEKIKIGTKTVELRLYDEKRRCLSKTSNELIIINNDKITEHVMAKIADLHIYPSFAELFETNLFEKCGFEGLTEEEAVKLMRSYYSPDDEKKYGVVGIELILY